MAPSCLYSRGDLLQASGIPLRALEEGTVGSDMPVNRLKYLNENYLGFVVYDALH